MDLVGLVAASLLSLSCAPPPCPPGGRCDQATSRAAGLSCTGPAKGSSHTGPKGETQPGEQRVIEALIRSLADEEPPASSLGTPILADTDATVALVGMGQAAVSALVKALDDPNPKIVMYSVYCLGQVGDPSVLPALHRTRAEYRARDPHGPYDFGIVSAVNEAELRLGSGHGER